MLLVNIKVISYNMQTDKHSQEQMPSDDSEASLISFTEVRWVFMYALLSKPDWFWQVDMFSMNVGRPLVSVLYCLYLTGKSWGPLLGSLHEKAMSWKIRSYVLLLARFLPSWGLYRKSVLPSQTKLTILLSQMMRKACHPLLLHMSSFVKPSCSTCQHT